MEWPCAATRPKARESGMAACCFESPEVKEAARRSREIDRYLKKEGRLRAASVLLLGTHASGKSTFIKQMRILHGKGYTDEERLEFRPCIYRTVLKGASSIVHHHQRLKGELRDRRNEKNCQLILDNRRDYYCLSSNQFFQYVDALRSIWSDEGIQAVVDRADEYHMVCLFVCMLLLV